MLSNYLFFINRLLLSWTYINHIYVDQQKTIRNHHRLTIILSLLIFVVLSSTFLDDARKSYNIINVLRVVTQIVAFCAAYFSFLFPYYIIIYFAGALTIGFKQLNRKAKRLLRDQNQFLISGCEMFTTIMVIINHACICLTC